MRRDFLIKVYRSEPNKQYFHFGDIDAGGFYIFGDLCEKTGIPFQPFSMDIDTLYFYKSYWKELTKNDVMRLQKIKTPVFQEVISYMLEQNCKLEQEVLDLV